MTTAWWFFIFNSAVASPVMERVIDRVEIQWSVCETSMEIVQKKLNLNFVLDEALALSYYDNPDLSLLEKNVVIRVRQGRKTKSTAKIRNLDVANIDWKWLENKDYKCEWDRFGFDRSIACSLSQKKQGVLSEDQLEFLKRMGSVFVNPYVLKQHGPYSYEKKVSVPSRPGEYELVIESATTSHGNVIEISVRTTIDKEESVYQDITTYLQKENIILCKAQLSFTERILKPNSNSHKSSLD